VIFWRKRYEIPKSSVKLVVRFPDCEFEVSIEAGDDYRRLLEDANKAVKRLREVDRR